MVAKFEQTVAQPAGRVPDACDISADRRRALIYPREHGAWGILLIPLVTGASVGLLSRQAGWRLAPLAIAVLSLFWLRTPLENWLGTIPTKARLAGEVRLARNVALLLAAISAASLAWLFHQGPNAGVLLTGAIAAAALAGQALIRLANRKARTAAQMVGAAGLTVVAPTAYYVVTGALDGVAWSLWLLNLLFAANQIQYVQLRIHAARAATVSARVACGKGFLAAQFLEAMLLAAAAFMQFISWYAALAFVPILCRGLAWFVSRFQPLAVHSLGKRELVHGLVFGVLLVAAFGLFGFEPGRVLR